MIPLSHPWNLVTAVHMVVVLQNLHSSNIVKGQAYLHATFAIVFLHFLYICIRIVFFKTTLASFNCPSYLAYVFIDFLICFIIIIVNLVKATQINCLDRELQKFYSKLLRQITCVREMA